MQPKIPAGTKKIVIFDTNAYRKLTTGLPFDQARSKALWLRTKEQECGNFALANPIVIWELMAHLDDASDPAYSHCLNGTVALGEHTSSPSPDSPGICLFADAESTVCQELFQKVPATATQNIQNFAKLARYVTTNAPNLTDAAVIQNLKTFSRELKNRERTWVADMKNVLFRFDPKAAQAWVGGTTEENAVRKLRNYLGSAEFMNAWAGAMVVRHAQYLGIRLSPQELAEKSEAMKKIFPVPFHMMSKLFLKFADSNVNLDSRKKKWENFMCDLSICFCIGNAHEIENSPLFLVTGDKAIKAAAVDASCSDRVITLNEYLATFPD